MPSNKISEYFADRNGIDNVDKVGSDLTPMSKTPIFKKNILYPYLENHWKNPEMFLFFPQ